MITCIYTITNKINGKIYVGKSNHFFSRKSHHVVDLRNNSHNNEHLQKAWNKYGEENFLFEVLEECEKEFLYSQEHYWCNILNTFDHNCGYNIKPTDPLNKRGNSKLSIEKTRKALLGRKLSIDHKQKLSIAKLGRQLSENTKLKMSIIKKGKVFSDDTKRKMSEYRYSHPLKLFTGKKHPVELQKQISEKRKVPIIQYTTTMEFIKEWKSGRDVYNELGISRGNISSCCKLKVPSAGGFVWRYKIL